MTTANILGLAEHLADEIRKNTVDYAEQTTVVQIIINLLTLENIKRNGG